MEQKALQSPCVILGIGSQRFIMLVNVGPQMLCVVKIHGFHVNIRFQRIVEIGKGLELKGIMFDQRGHLLLTSICPGPMGDAGFWQQGRVKFL